MMLKRDVDLKAAVEAAWAAAAAHRGEGKVASYIPALARVDPMKFGIAVVTRSGEAIVAGDADEAFSIQSISKVFMLALALNRIQAMLWERVGREPSGSAFNSIVQLEVEKGKPRNPLINAGALAVTDAVIGDGSPDEAVAALLDYLRSAGDDGAVLTDDEVATSESEAGARNRSLAYFLSAFGNLRNPVEDVLSAYFRQCATAMSCRQLARAGLHLAFDGRDPVTERAPITPSRSRRINSLMLTCGHYDNSGDFAFRVGLPGKSGVGGGILAIVPGEASVCVWSPGLNAAGTSLAGAIALEALVERTGWTVFA
ncbi:glutaminase [Allosphingosinicella indica]|uniref:Glutaminase n=1 Tax=Allosphingosinicella indica TaxID=941907 RepID=A0A1X7FZQ8_9SPHN|nr:glutaminase [Allosphingosinicella indica]SMF61594.1 L-glutaminase [Allosphingosinicella indica]